jgi:hypothetical protein
LRFISSKRHQALKRASSSRRTIRRVTGLDTRGQPGPANICSEWMVAIARRQ